MGDFHYIAGSDRFELGVEDGDLVVRSGGVETGRVRADGSGTGVFFSGGGANNIDLAATIRPNEAIAEVWPRISMSMANRAVLTSGQVALMAIALDEGVVINKITFFSGATAAGTPTNQVFGLYDSNLNLLATTVDDAATAWAANSKKQLALTAPFTTTYRGLYYVAVLVAATTVPTLEGGSTNIAAINKETPQLAGTFGTGLTALPASIPPASFTSLTLLPYAYVS